ncbi:MAG: TonB-dependent receptor [Sphingobium sp.]
MMKTTSRVTLAAGVAWLALSPQAGLAAEAPAEAAAAMADAAAPDAADDGEAIIVSGSPIRESMEASIMLQRNADNVINAITADDAGRFPDQTVAAALARLPGIGVQRDQGQERYVQVRGAPTRWTVVSFDGINVLGAEERIFRFDSVPAALISTVELNKTLLPDMPAEALAGRVNIKTWSAMDKPGFNGFVDLGYGFVDLGDGPQEQAAGRLSWSNDMFGITVAGSHSQFEQQTDNSEPRYDGDGALRELRNAKYIIEREINSLSGKLEFKPAEGHKITATSLYTEFLDHEQRNQYTFTFAGPDRTGTAGSVVDANVVGAFEQGEYKTSTFVNILHGDHDMGRLRLNWDAAYVETESSTELPIITQISTDAALRPDVVYTTGEYGLPVLTVTNANGTTGFLDQQAFDREIVTPYFMGSKTKSYTGKFDFAYDWDGFGGESTLKFGMQYDKRKSRDSGTWGFFRPDGSSGSFDIRSVAAQLGMPWTPGAFVTGKPVDEDMNRGYVFNYLNNAGMREQYDAIIAAAQDANEAGGDYLVPGPNAALASLVKERIIAGYVSNSWKWDNLSVVVGLRVENTKISSQGNALIGTTLYPMDVSSDNTFFFPSLHLSYDATDTLKFRGALVTGASRPSFSEQRATVTISDVGGSVAGGNPYLKPERAYGADASVEWYFAPASLLSVNGFYRKVKDTLFDATEVVGDNRFDSDGQDRSLYQYTTTLNGDDGKLYGVEFAYNQPFTFLPSPFDGLGAQASLTLVDGDFNTPDGRKVAFPGTSKRITNLSLFYEKAGFSARVGYQHRTKWLDDISTDANSDLYWDANERIDLSFRYQAAEGFTLYADVVNLTNEAGIRYQGTRATPYEVELFGRRFLFGVKANF